MTFDLIIRNGTVVDGLGEPYVGDVAVSDGVIAAVRASRLDTHPLFGLQLRLARVVD